MQYLIRRLFSADRVSVQALYRLLDPAALRRRFGLSLNPAAVEKYINRMDFDQGLILGAFDGQRLVGICESFALHIADQVVEAAFVVDPEYQGRKVGQALGEALLERTQGHVVVACVADNPRMSGLARRLGFTRVGHAPASHHGLAPAVVKDLYTPHGLFVRKSINAPA